MTYIKRISAVVAVAALCVALTAPVVAASDITVGNFVQRLAQSKGLAATDARIASDALRGVGVRIPGDLVYANALTEGDVARISRAAGINVRTSNPENLFNTEQVNLFFVSFGDDLGNAVGTMSDDNPGQGSGPGNGNGGPPFDPFTKGKHGKGKGKGVFTPTDPE